MIAWYVDLFARHRGAVALLVVAMSIAALVGLRRLAFDDSPRGIFASDSPEFALLESVYDEFGSDDNEALLVLEADDWFTGERIAFLRELARRVRALDGIESVITPADVPVFGESLLPRPLLPGPNASTQELERARRAAHAHPLVAGRLLSPSGTTVLFAVRLAGGALTIRELKPVVESLRAVTRELSGDGVRVRLTGVPPIRVDIYETIRFEQVLFFVLGASLCFLLAYALFRHAPTVLAATVAPIVGSFWALGFIGLSGTGIDLLGTVVPTLVIVIGFTDSVHLVSDMRVSRDAGASPMEATTSALRHLGGPCFLTSITTAIGFGSLAVGNVQTVTRFGVMASCSVLLAFAAVITTLPLVASTLPRMRRPDASTDRAREGEWSRRFGAFADALCRHARPVSGVGLVTTIALFAGAARLQPENRLLESTVVSSEAHQAIRHAEEEFGGVLPGYVLVEWGGSLAIDSPELLDVLRELEALLDEDPVARAPVSFASLLDSVSRDPTRATALLRALPSDLRRRFVREDLGKALVTFQAPDAGSDVLEPMVERITSGMRAIEQRHPGLRLHLTGTDVVARSSINRIISDLATSLFFAGVVIFLLIALEFRSVGLGLISLVPNLFPLAFIGWLLWVTGRPLQVPSAVLFTVLLGLAVDDTIHFLARYRRELAGEPLRDRETVRAAVRAALLGVGKPILITTVVLGAGFGIVVFSAVPTNQLFSVLVCIGLVAALVGDLVFLPALLALRASLQRG